jgi:hypothetical protein
MLLYSDTTISFIQRVREEIRAIVNLEIAKVLPISMQRSRILYNKITYPLSIVVFEDKTRLGYFDSQLYELGISKNLMLSAQDEVLKNIIRHELAHFICYILNGSTEAHGIKFKEVCRQMNWNDEVERAYANIAALNEEILEQNTKTEQLLLKLKKLMALASSDNPHEAEIATIKANQLLLEHNLSYLKDINSTETESFVVKRVLKSSRKTTKHDAIYAILQTFCVAPVLNFGTGIFYLEVTGDKTSVLLADYVANFLDKELDVLWKNAQKENSKLKGLASKNSFFRGVAAGYVMKINQEKSNSANCHELVLIETNLARLKSIAYPRLHGSSAPSPKNDSHARNIGFLKGRNLSIKPGLNASTSRIFLLQ